MISGEKDGNLKGGEEEVNYITRLFGRTNRLLSFGATLTP
jgi:hypothetical protein